MPSVLSWIDHDSAARERTLRMLSLFQEKESRDELGLGAIRDSIADQLFPGTSTIQTRLRYMLFIPWLYQSLEKSDVGGDQFVTQADQLERNLVQPLLDSDDQFGVFGKTSGNKLKRLPSSVYWAGLGSWKIRRTPWSQGEYHARIDEIYKQRKKEKLRETEASKQGDDADIHQSNQSVTWDSGLPAAPRNFPEHASFTLTQDEAEYFCDRLKFSHPNSLLSFLALNSTGHDDVITPWEHPDYSNFLKSHQELLKHAQLFSEVMHGASILYNVQLARLRKNNELTDKHLDRFNQWADNLPLTEVKTWNLQRFWHLTLYKGHSITPNTKHFIETWVSFSCQYELKKLPSLNEALEHIKQREMKLKRSQSRFKNRRALEQWGGSSGLNKLTYRWPTVKVLLNDLYNGLSQDNNA